MDERKSAIVKLLRILNSLRYTSAVDRATLAKACGVGERTVYRYLSLLSEAGVPIYYDSEIGAYCLARPLSVTVPALSDTDVYIMRFALTLLEQALAPEQRAMIRDLQRRLPGDNAVIPLEVMTTSGAASPSCVSPGTVLNLNLLLAAVEHERKVAVYLTAGDELQRRVFTSPRLTYFHGWMVEDDESTNKDPIALGDITRIALL